MKCGDWRYIWQNENWPHFRYDPSVLVQPLAAISRMQGLLLGRLTDAGFNLRDQVSLLTLTEDVLKTSQIEGELLNVQSVRSSLARRLGVELGGLTPIDRNAEGVVEMVLDATTHANAPLTAKRLFGWHAALFPTGHSGMLRIAVARWRNDALGPMQVVSGPLGRQIVHYEAPPAACLPKEIKRFLTWANRENQEPALLQAGLAHLWFLTLHPFEDGNGRIARALADLFLTRADGQTQRFYSLSGQIQRERSAYYEILERTQRGNLDVTEYLLWFLEVLGRALQSAQSTLDTVLFKARFWQRIAGTALNERQVQLINRLLDGFEGKLTSRKWATLTKCSADTALRDINHLIQLGILQKLPAGGRSTAYELAGEANTFSMRG